MADILRRAAGARRPPRYWDRSLWFCGVAIALLVLPLAGYSIAVMANGSPIEVTFNSCSTKYNSSGRFGRFVTTCEIALAGGVATQAIQTAREHQPGDRRTLTIHGGQVSDPELNHDYAWLLPVGLIVLGGTWWLGFPPRKARAKPHKPKHLT